MATPTLERLAEWGGAGEEHLLAALRRGDEAAFVALVERYHGRLLRLARTFVANEATAEEVVQETWQGVLVGLPRFQGRAPLATWIYRILTNCARTRGRRERRTVSFSSLAPAGAAGAGEDEEAGDLAAAAGAVPAGRFRGAWPLRGHWISVPDSWDEVPEARLLAQETLDVVARAVAALPPLQRAVLTLRDVEHRPAIEVCALLRLSDGNQRVLLHRARARVRRVLEAYLTPAVV